VLGLVESKRQYTNRSFQETDDVISDPMTHGDEFIEGEIVG
jgi:hypothetical protein